MMNSYSVSSQVDSQKFGRGKLVAELSHDDFMKYANLSDKEKLAFLKEHGAQLQVDLASLQESEVNEFHVDNNQEQSLLSNNRERPTTMRKMRMNINGQDTGWLDVTEENETQYNKMMNQFNKMQQQFNQRFGKIFGDSFSPRVEMTPTNLLDDSSSEF